MYLLSKQQVLHCFVYKIRFYAVLCNENVNKCIYMAMILCSAACYIFMSCRFCVERPISPSGVKQENTSQQSNQAATTAATQFRGATSQQPTQFKAPVDAMTSQASVQLTQGQVRGHNPGARVSRLRQLPGVQRAVDKLVVCCCCCCYCMCWAWLLPRKHACVNQNGSSPTFFLKKKQQRTFS